MKGLASQKVDLFQSARSVHQLPFYYGDILTQLDVKLVMRFVRVVLFDVYGIVKMYTLLK